MNAKELMLENIIRHVSTGDNIIVTPNTLVDCWEYPHKYEPIPLSPEILERCGFYFKPECSTKGGFIKQFEKSKIELFHIPHNFGSWHVIMTLSPVHSIGITVIQCVHELQNLIYSLYKTELNIKL